MALSLRKNILMPLRTYILRTFATTAEASSGGGHESNVEFLLSAACVIDPCPLQIVH